MKVLGMTRRNVLSALATEYALIGVVAGIIGGLGGGVLSWLVVTQGMEIPWEIRPRAFAGVLATGVSVAVLTGTAASLGALRKRPIEALRQE